MWRGEATYAHHLTLGQIVWMHFAPGPIAHRATASTPLPRWRDDDAAPGPSDTLGQRYRRMLRYWDHGRRPEGRPGSQSEAQFLRLHSR